MHHDRYPPLYCLTECLTALVTPVQSYFPSPKRCPQPVILMS